MNQKHVKIVGLSVNNKFGGLEATNLTFNPNNKIVIVKGEVGSGKTTLNKALSIPTKGTKTLEDKKLYGDNINLTAQLTDGDHNVFVNAKSDKNGKIVHTIYTIDKDGNKLKDVVIDGSKLTPSNYLKSLQTELTWRLDELTSENPTVQRNLLLELYSNELSSVGVVFDKKNPAYVGGIIDQIEKAKQNRSYMDMKRKEVGGIADDMTKKGIDFSNKRELKDVDSYIDDIQKIKSKITLSLTHLEQQRENELLTLQNKGAEINMKLIKINEGIEVHNKNVNLEKESFDQLTEKREDLLKSFQQTLLSLIPDSQELTDNIEKIVVENLDHIKEPILKTKTKIKFNEKNQCISTSSDSGFTVEISNLLDELVEIKTEYLDVQSSKNGFIDNSKLEEEIDSIQAQLDSANLWNNEAKAINALHDWREANDNVNDLKNDYYLKLTEINTGIEGLHIIPENDDSGNIFLAYNGVYDTNYFHNPNKELRKLSAYSDTQKPMICLLIQKYLLGKRSKIMPYLWIDKVPIDNKTRSLIEKMSEDLNLWLFVSWTGDFEKENLKEGELLIDNGEIFFNI